MQRGVNDWFALFASWLQRAFPAATVTQRNGCVPATTAEYVSMCLVSVDSFTRYNYLRFSMSDAAAQRRRASYHWEICVNVPGECGQLKQLCTVICLWLSCNSHAAQRLCAGHHCRICVNVPGESGQLYLLISTCVST